MPYALPQTLIGLFSFILEIYQFLLFLNSLLITVCYCPRYRVLYNYKPQNEDELELAEGETVYVMEKCDDGWYVGSSQRTGYLGTFPGNYVERQV